MSATQTEPPPTDQRDLPALIGDKSLVVNLTTQRGTAQLSLAQLESKVSHYPEDIRDATRVAQRFFVDHCHSNIEQFMGIARNVLSLDRGSSYFSNWLKGFYFLTGGGKLEKDSKGYTAWLNFCSKLASYYAKLQGKDSRTLVTPTIRAIEANIAEIFDLDNPCRIGGVAGATGTQKTEGLKYVATKRGGYPFVNYFDCTEGLGVGGLKRGIGDLFKCKVGNKAGILDRAIAENLGPDRALFLDNIQRAVNPDEESAVVDWIIRLQEGRNFPLYLTFTKGWKKKLNQKDSFMEQLVGRIGGMNEILELDDYPTRADLRVFQRHHKLADSALDDYLIPWSLQLGRIRIVVKRLWRAKQLSLSAGKENITLEHLELADSWVPLTQVEDEGGES